jgi:hypothetical protein
VAFGAGAITCGEGQHGHPVGDCGALGLRGVRALEGLRQTPIGVERQRIPVTFQKFCIGALDLDVVGELQSLAAEALLGLGSFPLAFETARLGRQVLGGHHTARQEHQTGKQSTSPRHEVTKSHASISFVGPSRFLQQAKKTYVLVTYSITA